MIAVNPTGGPRPVVDVTAKRAERQSNRHAVPSAWLHGGVDESGTSRVPRLSTLLAALIVVNQAVGVACQFAQRTDPRFPLYYFTVDSAVLAGVAAMLALGFRDGPSIARVRLVAAVGVVVSGIVFATVIAPATETGTWFQPHDDLPVRTATLLMHGVAPVLVIADYLRKNSRLSVRATVLWSYPWPLSYLAGMGVLAALYGSDVMPYPFLLPSISGGATVVGAYAGLIALVGLVGLMLGLSNGWATSHPRRNRW
jgi:hypothetical protein